MTQIGQPTDKDELLHKLLQELAARGLARKWAEAKTPYSDLSRECNALNGDPPLQQDFGDYLRTSPI